jgi:hypothetical protein
MPEEGMIDGVRERVAPSMWMNIGDRTPIASHKLLHHAHADFCNRVPLFRQPTWPVFIVSSFSVSENWCRRGADFLHVGRLQSEKSETRFDKMCVSVGISQPAQR